ncbi:hypothetical protein P7C73_g1061, partial [Tremellales sp. Uapishka_1]
MSDSAGPSKLPRNGQPAAFAIAEKSVLSNNSGDRVDLAKLKCDKVYPCSRCVARGLEELCEQETVMIKGHVTGGGHNSGTRRQPSLAQLSEENRILHRKVVAQENTIRSLRDQLGEVTVTRGSNRAQGIPQATASGYEADRESIVQPTRESSVDIEVAAAALDERAGYLGKMDQVFGLSGQEMAEGEQPIHLFAQPGSHIFDSLRKLVLLDFSSALVRHHCNFLHWIHPVFHVPTFLEEHDQWIASIQAGEPAPKTYGYYALYFSVIACGLYFMDEDLALEMGMQKDAIAILPKFWFDLALNCLQLSGFMNFPTIPVLQAICILPAIAHAFDASKHLASLMHCALGLARDLKFHLIQAGTPSTLWGGNIKAQILRRIWSCLVVADSLTPGAHHPFHLIYPAARTSPPANIDDVDLSDDAEVVERPLNQVTCVSQLLVIGRLSDIFRDFSHSFASKQSVQPRFQWVKTFDERLDRLFDECPELKPSEEVYSPSYDPSRPYDWRQWSRYLWGMSIPALRIHLWRHFLGRSYTDHRFAEARKICVAAARATIAARLKPVPILFQKNWHVSSYTVMSGMVLAIELMNSNVESSERHALHGEIVAILNLLRANDNPNAMVKRGVSILEKMLLEAEITISTKVLAAAPPINVAQSSDFTINFSASLDDGHDWNMMSMLPESELESDLYGMLLGTGAWASESAGGEASRW